MFFWGMLRSMQNHTRPDSDRPLTNEAADLFNFAGIAKRLAPAILKTFETDGMVVGLEGPWGSGKTTLLNFLRTELDRSKPSTISVISIAPWLGGDRSNLVSSLLTPIADILDRIEEANSAKKHRYWQRAKKKGSALGDTLRSYGVRTGRMLAPAARFAEYFLPGSKIAADAMDVGSQYLEGLQRHPTTAETKADISIRLSALDIGFVVILDDLDRLEPEQAVEVVRLVRSVADFPKITYIMCYDREALSHALKSGLKIEDGDQFLQKIVQLTFTMPLPEPFDMRSQFREEALAIYEEVTGSPAEGELLEDLRSAIDREGGGLKTPREVKLALNSLRFLYPSIKDDVYFPDMCRLHLIKTTRPGLYRWLEEYLSTRSVLVTGDAMVSGHEKADMGRRLKELLPAEDTMSSQSIWSLRRFIPGIVKHDKSEECVFANTTYREVRDMIALRRLGSPVHYRHYFALTYPKTVMPDNEFNGLLAQTASNVTQLANKLAELAKTRRSSGKSWFEHVLDRLDEEQIKTFDAPTLSGLALAIAGGMDRILAEDNTPRPFGLSVSDLAAHTVRDCLRQLKTVDAERFGDCANKLASECPSINWLIGHFFRNEIFAHGRVGERKQDPAYWAFSEAELDDLIKILKRRATTEAKEDRLPLMPDFAAYIYGWRDLSGIAAPKRWVRKKAATDEGFLFILEKLRSWAVSDKVYYPLSKQAVSIFLDWNETIQRLENLADTKHAEMVKDLKLAIQQGRH